MKFILTMVFLAAVMLGNAQEVGETQNTDAQPEGQAFHGRAVMQIEKTELPEVVQRMVSNGEFRRWEITEAYKIEGGAERLDGQSSYIVVVVRKNERFALYYNAEGRLIRQELMDMLETSSR